MSEHTYLIGDLAKEFGVTLRALRFYQDRGLLSPRREGSTRIYSADDRARLARILAAKKLGFTLSEVRAMLAKDAGAAGAAGAELPLTEEQIETQIAHLERQKEEIAEALAELRARLSDLRARSQAA